MRKKSITIALPLVLALTLLTFMAVAAGGPWSDNFDSYADGSNIHGQGGWIGWGNVPGAGGDVSSAQARSAPHSLEVDATDDPIQQFTSNSGQWVLTAWQYIPGNYTGQSYFIMLNTYDDACATCNWSLQICFDSVTGNAYDDVGATCTGNSVPFVTDVWAEIRVEIDLDADQFDVLYNGATLVDDGVWSQHVSGGGVAEIANVDLWANSASPVYYDDMSLEPMVQGEPGLEVDKSPDTQNVTTGGNADFTITITNTGTLTWTNVTATDAMVPACDNAFTDMGPGAVESYSCTDVGVAGGYTNTVVVSASIPGGPSMAMTDTAVVTTSDPTSVSLSGLGGDSAASPMIWVITLGVAIAAGVFVFQRRRQQI